MTITLCCGKPGKRVPVPWFSPVFLAVKKQCNVPHVPGFPWGPSVFPWVSPDLGRAALRNRNHGRGRFVKMPYHRSAFQSLPQVVAWVLLQLLSGRPMGMMEARTSALIL